MKSGSWRCLGLAALVVCTACQKGNVQVQRKGPRPTPAPTTFTGTVDAANRAQVIAYAAGLQYDYTPPAADSQYMLVKGSGGQWVLGPWAVLAPEVGSAAVDHDAAAHGRIAAKLTLDAPHPDLKLPAGTSYVWVDSTGNSWRAVLIPELATAPLVHVPLTRVSYGPADMLLYAVVRLTPPPRGPHPPGAKDGMCFPCDNGWCCSQGGY